MYMYDKAGQDGRCRLRALMHMHVLVDDSSAALQHGLQKYLEFALLEKLATSTVDNWFATRIV